MASGEAGTSSVPMIPHVLRLLVGSDHWRVLSLSLLVGAIALIWVGVVARTAFAPQNCRLA